MSVRVNRSAASAMVALAAACGGGGGGGGDGGGGGGGDGGGGSGQDGPRADARPPGEGGALAFVENAPRSYDHAVQATLPAPFGVGEYTLELRVLLDDTYPVGPARTDTDQQRTEWYDGDPAPYGSSEWWFKGNFLLDGHNNNSFDAGTLSLQLVAGGAPRWLVGDGGDPGPGALLAVQARPAGPSLLDGQAHDLALVRRWAAGGGARYEAWVDGALIATATSPVRTDMRTWWDAWVGYPPGQAGWFWGAEKQAAIGALGQYEDYKGLVADVRLWSRALAEAELATAAVDDPAGLTARYQFGEGGGDQTCAADGSACWRLVGMDAGAWRPAP